MAPEDARRADATTTTSDQPDAPTRILNSAVRLLTERGVARFNLQDVAEAAAVSKGLIHYHYHDKDTLLTRLVESLAAGVVSRQAEALQGAADVLLPGGVVEDLCSELGRTNERQISSQDGPAIDRPQLLESLERRLIRGLLIHAEYVTDQRHPPRRMRNRRLPHWFPPRFPDR